MQIATTHLAAPALDGDERPDCLHDTERPRALQESIHGGERARASEPEHKPRASILEGVEDHHRGHGDDAEKRERFHARSLAALTDGSGVGKHRA